MAAYSNNPGVSRKRKMTICEEPSTLVYTLLKPTAKLTFENFHLIVRSLHTYMVESITPMPETNCVHVKLGYLASVKNAFAKLGKLQLYATVHKLSAHVQDHELSALDALQKEFNFGGPSESDNTAPTKKRKRYIPSVELPEEYSEPEHE